MKQKLTYLFSLMLLYILGTVSAVAETAIFSSPETDKPGSITVGQVTLTDPKGGKLQQGSGSYKVNIGGTDYTPLKISGSSQINISIASGYEINSITVYARSNANDTPCTAGSTSDDKSTFTVPARNSDPAQLDYTGRESLYFTAQSNVVIVVDYSAIATAAPVFTTNLEATAEATVGIAKTFTVATDNATSYQWYVGGEAVEGATSASYDYVASATGAVEIYCDATNKIGSTKSTVCTVTAEAPAAAPTITTNLEAAYNVQLGKTITLSIEAENAASYQWYVGDVAVEGATSASYTYSASDIMGTAVVVYCAAINAAGSTNSNNATITTVGSTACQLTNIKFSNSAYGAISEPVVAQEAVGEEGEEGYKPAVEAKDAEIKVPYLAGTEAPTIDDASVVVSSDATWAVEGNVLTVTAQDGVTKTAYNINKVEITPLEVTPGTDIAATTFTEVPSWVFNPYGWDAQKGVKFAKPVDDANNMRIAKGNTRQYYFIEAAKTLTLTSGSGGARPINVYKNGEKLSTPTTTAATGSSISIALDEEAPCMITIESGEGNSGDGGFVSYAVTAPAEEEEVEPTPGDAAYDNVPATFSWAIGNEEEATIEGTNVADAVKSTKVKVGTGLSTSVVNNYAANSGVSMVAYTPATSKPGTVATAMVEYTVKMAKGVTFTPTSVTYDAIKKGTDNATYSWSYTVDGVESAITEVAKENILRDNNTTGTPALGHVETISDASAGRTVTFRLYVSGFDNTKQAAFSNIKINGVVNGTPEVRTFTDFKIEFRENPYTVLLPESGELPEGVTVSGQTYNGGQHGVQHPTITVPVDGPVKFTIGACQYSGSDITISDTDGGSVLFSNKAACGEQIPNYNQYVVYTYNVEKATTLTFEFGSNAYVPYFFAEACDYVESVDVTYYDTDGKTVIGTKTVDGSSALAYAYGEEDVTVADGYKFRGWFADSSSKSVKVAEGTSVDSDLSLYAHATEIEKVEMGKVFKYDMTKPYFYIEDHEAISVDGGHYHNTHGFVFANGQSFSVDVAGNAQIILGLCAYSGGNPITVTKTGAETAVGTIESDQGASDGATTSFQYNGEATTLTFTFAGTAYIHSVSVYNVAEQVSKDAETGYYVVPANDGASLELAIASASAASSAESPAVVFIPNGTYEIDGSQIDGNANVAAMTISGNNVSIIGESRDGVVIKTHITAEQESLKSALLGITGENTYIQDVTLINRADFDKTDGAERANAIRDVGNYSVLNNVYLKGTQDVYLTYRNKDNVAQKIFVNGGKIEGTVDFICGAGDVFFNGVNLYCANSATAGKTTEDYICAPATYDYENYGYVFNKCVITGEASQAYGATPNKGYYLVRTWQNDPKATYIDVDYSALAPHPDLFKEMNANTTTAKCHSYSSSDAEAANYSMENVLGASFAAEAQAAVTQAAAPTASISGTTITITPANGGGNGVYLIEKDGEFVALTSSTTYELEAEEEVVGNNVVTDAAEPVYTVRAANAKGGFGEPATVSQETAVEVVEAAPEAKAAEGAFIIGDKVVIVKDGKQFTAAGARIK